jgi:hypothetical protein
VKGENGSVSEKLDFKLQIPCSVFLSSDPISGDQFAELLASQELIGKDKAVCEGIALSQVQPFFKDWSFNLLLFFNTSILNVYRRLIVSVESLICV